MSKANSIEMLCMLTAKISGFFAQLSEIMMKEMVSFDSNHNAQAQVVNGVVKPPDSPRSEVISSLPLETIQVPKRHKHLKKKDPMLPKAPASSYLLFFKDRRSQLKQMHKECTSSELTKLASHQWMNLPQEQKQKYIDMGNQEKERYYKQMEKFRQTEGVNPKENKIKAKKKKTQNATIVLPEESKVSSSVKEISSASSSSGSSSSMSKSKKKKDSNAVICIPSESVHSQDSLGIV